MQFVRFRPCALTILPERLERRLMRHVGVRGQPAASRQRNHAKLITVGFEFLCLVTKGLSALMFKTHILSGLLAAESLLIGCGGKVADDSAQSRNSGTGGSDGASHSGGGASEQNDTTGGSSASITAIGGPAATSGLQPITEVQQDDSATIQIFAGCTVVPCIY